MKKINLILILALTITINFFTYAFSNISIALKIDETAVTNYDIDREAKYLKALNNQLKNLENKKVLEIAKESIIKEIIKKNELDKYYILDQSDPLLDQIVKNFYLTLNLKSESEFVNYLSKYDYTLQEVKKKIEIETTWNNLVYNRYSEQIKINKKALMDKIKILKKSQKKTSYLLSEIVFEKKVGVSIKDTTKRIKESINEIGFDNTANIYSIADSAKFGGKVGWIEEKNLSPKLKSQIQLIKLNDYSEPILLNNNFLIFKVNDIKKEAVVINEKIELKKMIDYETNRQLAQFSKIHYNKIKINIKIDEF